jgi:putative DNA primase/helicase
MTTAAQIAERLGLAKSGEGFTGFCPSCVYDPGFSVAEKHGKVLVHCHAGGCTQAELIQALREWEVWGDAPPRPVEFPAESPSTHPPPTRRASSLEAAQAMWGRSQPASGTIVETYLRARGYQSPIPATLRFVNGKHPSDEQFHPAMLAAAILLTDPPKIVGVHRTFLHEDGSGKASLNPDKMSLGDIRGAGVPFAALGQTVAVSEGIETGLSVQQATGIPAVAALSAAGMQALLLPAGVTEVIIAADADEVGIKAAHAAARRWYEEGRRVRIAKPPQGRDFNDLARSGQ